MGHRLKFNQSDWTLESSGLTVTEWLNNNVIWLIPAAPLLACAWIVVIGHVVRRQYAHRPLVLGLAVSFAASLYLLLVVVPHEFGHDHEPSRAVVKTIYQWIEIGSLD